MNRFDPLPGHPYYGAETWIDRLFSLLPGNKESWATVDRGMVADPMRALLDAYGPLAAPLLQLLSDEELARVSPGGKLTRKPAPPSLADFFPTPVLKPPRY